MKTADPESRALALVRTARRRTFCHRAVRAAARGTVAGGLFAVALAAAARLAGVAPGPWILVALLPAFALAFPALRRARPDPVRAALLLDRAAGTKERFATVVVATDPEVRELAARQAIASPSLRNGAFPLSFPPTTEGLAAVLSLVLLAALIFLVPPPAGREAPSAAPGGASSAVAGGAPAAGTESRPANAADAAATAPAAGPSRAVAKLVSGEGLDEDEWDALAAKGVSREERNRIEAALRRGDPAAAAAALRAALENRSRPAPGAAPSGAGPAAGGDWTAYRRALANPVWSPEHDDVVRRYFEAMAPGR